MTLRTEGWDRLRRWTARAVALSALGLGGCGVYFGKDGAASAPQPERREASDEASLALAAAFEQRELARAVDLTNRQQLADALVTWEVLILLRPESESYRTQAESLRARIQVLAGERNAAAAKAMAGAQLDAAQRLYLQALALDPANTAAASGLRAIERERNRHTVLRKTLPPLQSQPSREPAALNREPASLK